MNPSVSLVLERDSLSPAAPLDWVVPVGDQDVDYRYDGEATPPSTADIAHHFAPLTAAQHERVMDYCANGLLDKYRGMELPEESFFEKPRVWRLSVFDHAGEGTHFHYRIEGDDIDVIAGVPDALSWTTEVPVARLYAALELGEALTSMYMRMNDAVFDDETEADLRDAELVDDPLIRCLFNDVFGAYQAAQLRRIKERA
jgi:hypothetical protein